MLNTYSSIQFIESVSQQKKKPILCSSPCVFSEIDFTSKCQGQLFNLQKPYQATQ